MTDALEFYVFIFVKRLLYNLIRMYYVPMKMCGSLEHEFLKACQNNRFERIK